MFNGTRLLQFAPALCAIFIVLGVTVLKPAHTSDFSLGANVGSLIGLSIIAILVLNRGRPPRKVLWAADKQSKILIRVHRPSSAANTSFRF